MTEQNLAVKLFEGSLKKAVKKVRDVAKELAPEVVGRSYWNYTRFADALKAFEGRKQWASRAGIDIKPYETQVEEILRPYKQMPNRDTDDVWDLIPEKVED